MRSVVKPILEILAGIPSVVLGFFALVWIGPNIVQTFFGAPPRSAWPPPASASAS